MAAGQLRPDLDIAELAVAGVPANHDAAPRPRARRARPDDVGVFGVRRGESALAAAHGDPFGTRNRPADAPEAAGAAVAGPTERRPVLPVAEHVVRDRIVHRDVVHLADGQLGGVPRHAPVHRDRHVLVVAHDHAVAVQRVDPHVVEVAAGPLQTLVVDVGAAAVQRARKPGGLEVDFVRVVRAGETVVVVGGASAQVAGVVHELPGRAPVERAPELAALGLAPVPGHAVARFDERVDPIGIRPGQADVGLPDRQHRQPVALEFRPRVPAVVGHVDAAALAAALPAPGVDLHRPHAGEQLARVGGVHLDAGSAGVLVHEEHVLPALPAVHGAEHAARLLRSVRVTQSPHVHDIRVVRMDDDARHACRPAFPQTHMTPRRPRVGGLVDAGAERDVRANVWLAGAGPDDRGVRGRHGHRPYRMIGLAVKDGLPVLAAVGRLPDPARCGARVVGHRVSRHSHHRSNAVSDRPDVAVAELLVGFGRDLLGGTCARQGERCGKQAK